MSEQFSESTPDFVSGLRRIRLMPNKTNIEFFMKLAVIIPAYNCEVTTGVGMRQDIIVAHSEVGCTPRSNGGESVSIDV
jgi:hypothetical protein